MELKRRDAPGGGQESGETPEETPRREPTPKKREVSVLIYTSVLFIVALALILLSYFIQQRTTSKLAEVSSQHGAFSTMAMQNIEELQNRNQELTDQLNSEKEASDALRAELEQARNTIDQMTAEIAVLDQGAEAASIEKEKLQQELESQRKKTEALGLLAALLASEDGADTSAILAQLEPLQAYLDGAYLNIYRQYTENN